MTQSITGTCDALLFSLRSLYGRHGYSHYKMNKFEEYDLYAHNKDFLLSDSVITFTDGNGKLLALKPDVTLSIVKNSKDSTDYLQKLYYNENVYRVSDGSRNFREIMQVGLECIGNVDAYCIYEVLKLAAKSLEVINASNVLCVSHLGILLEVMDHIGVPQEKKADVLHCVGEKNLHELSGILQTIGIPAEKADLLKQLVRTQGNVKQILPQIRERFGSVVSGKTLSEFVNVLSALEEENSVRIDFSVVSDIHYYNGFVFKGYVEGIPDSVLSGGQYDMLMRRMGRSSRAVGFAVYLDTIERFIRLPEKYDVDTVILYDPNDALGDIQEQVNILSAGGESVLAVTVLPENIKYKKIVQVQNGSVKNIEINA